jgi:hypothetical protein
MTARACPNPFIPSQSLKTLEPEGTNTITSVRAFHGRHWYALRQNNSISFGKDGLVSMV